jgi:hypothetical protein
VGGAARLIPAGIAPARIHSFHLHDVILVMEPEAPEIDVFQNDSGWVSGADHCTIDGDLLFRVPVPDDFVVGNQGSGTPNHYASFLLPDGVTLRETEPFYRCSPGGHGTAATPPRESDIRGDGLTGGTGASGVSALGGTLRLGELRPGGAPPRHALRLHLDAAENVAACDAPTECHRWPATTANSYGPSTYGGAVPALRLGALLVLHRDQDIAALGLESEPGRQIAWTLRHFGAYVVNDAARSVYSFAGELSPRGSFEEQLRQDWSLDTFPLPEDTPLARDMQRIFAALFVVDDNGPESIGGAGEPLTQTAPPLMDP